jgi:hypothetical protein
MELFIVIKKYKRSWIFVFLSNAIHNFSGCLGTNNLDEAHLEEEVVCFLVMEEETVVPE